MPRTYVRNPSIPPSQQHLQLRGLVDLLSFRKAVGSHRITHKYTPSGSVWRGGLGGEGGPWAELQREAERRERALEEAEALIPLRCRLLFEID